MPLPKAILRQNYTKGLRLSPTSTYKLFVTSRLSKERSFSTRQQFTSTFKTKMIDSSFYASEKSKYEKSSFNINTKSLRKIYEHAG